MIKLAVWVERGPVGRVDTNMLAEAADPNVDVLGESLLGIVGEKPGGVEVKSPEIIDGCKVESNRILAAWYQGTSDKRILEFPSV